MKPILDQRTLNRWHFVGIAVLVFACLFLALTIRAQSTGGGDESYRARPTLTQSGKLFVVQFTPADRKISVVAVGKPVVVLEPPKIEISARAYPSSQSPRNLSIEHKKEGGLSISESLAISTPIEIKVRDPKRSESETFRFNFKQ